MSNKRIEKVVLDILSFYNFGVHSEEELTYLKKDILALKEIRDEGTSPYSDTDEIIEKGEDAIERYYSYMEERASLGDNWW